MDDKTKESVNVEDIDYDEAIKSKSLEMKTNYILYRMRRIEGRLDDNGLSQKVFRNSWAVGIFGTALAGLLGALLSGTI